MQTPKARNGSSEVPQKASPVTPRTARQLKISPESDSASVPPASRTPKDRSPKVITRSPRSPVTAEKKRPSRLTELESQVAKLHEDLKAAKDQLESSESSKNHAQQEAEEAKKQLTALNVKLDESQCQFLALSASEKARLQQLQEISQVQDQSWQSELDSVQKQHSVDAAALTSAIDEIERLKIQLERTANSEACQAKHVEITRGEIQSLNSDLEERIALVENLNSQLKDCKDSEAQAQARLNETLLRFESVKATAESLQADGIKAMEAYGFLCSELEKSKLQINSLEELVSQLQVDSVNARSSNSGNPSGAVDEYTQKVGDGKVGETTKFQTEVNSTKFDVEHLGSALEAAELRYQEEQIRSSMEIHKAYELVEQTKSEASSREAALESELKKTKDHMDELKATLMEKETELQNVSEENESLKVKIVNNLSSERISEVEMELKKSNADVADLKASLMDKETELQNVSEENESLKVKIVNNLSSERISEVEMELKKSNADVADLKASLMDKETELQSISEENEMLKSEFKKREMERVKANDETIAEVEAARAAEQEALMKLTYVKEQADESSRREVRVTEQLEAAQASNSEMDAELRRLKVQADQWRKAAEAAAAVLSTGNNGKYMDRSGSLDSNYHPVTGKLCSPYSEDLDDDSPKKKNNNVLKKFGVLWKKGSK